MFHKIKIVMAAPDYKLMVMFDNEDVKEYDVKPLIEKNEKFKKLKDVDLFCKVHKDIDRCGVIWDDTIDISSEEIWDNGEIMKRYTIEELKKELGID